MDEVLAFLKKNPTYYLGTVDGTTPQVRPFGTICEYEGQLYIQTGRVKKVFKEIEANPAITICGFDAEAGTWLRVNATAAISADIKAEEKMLSEYPSLQKMYQPGDGNTVVIALTNATARFCSFTAPERVVEF